MIDERTASATDVTVDGGGGGHGMGETMTSESGDRLGRLELDVGVLPVVEPSHYDLGGEHARGGLGRVLRARDVRLRRQVAIKELLRETDDTRARFVRETWITARLQHPGIVPIYEAGRWPNGRPFYAMRLVAGQTLSAVIAATRDLGDRLSHLPKVLAVAETMAYAHSQRVVHRDLKPSNILVGDYGETVVIDWGLAKHLDEPSADGVTAPAPDLADAGIDTTVTEAGRILGTPSYMSPEQARGEPSDSRADVYSLGAILYHLLAGVQPYGGGRGDVIAAVASRPPPSLASRCPELAPDLLAIVAKAMARDLEARYPSAAELAADLKRFQTGQLVRAHRYSARSLLARWLRRHRAAVTIAAVALTALAVGGAFSVANVIAARDQARRQEARAVQQRRAAEELVDYMLGEQRSSLEALGKLELMEGVGLRVAAYYDRLRSDGLDREGRERRAQALVEIAAAYRLRNRPADAERLLLDALAERRALSAAGGDREKNLHGVVAGYTELADTALMRGAPRTAAAHAATALALLAPLAVLAPGDHGVDQQRHLAYLSLGDAMRTAGTPAQALAAYRQAVAILEAMPASAREERDLMAAQTRVADAELQTGDGAHAVLLYRQAAAVAARRASAAPDDLRLQDDLVVSLLKEGQAAKQTGDLAAAMQTFTAARSAAEALVARDPLNSEWQHMLCAAGSSLGEAAAAAGDRLQARSAFDGCATIARRMIERGPAVARWYAILAEASLEAGRVSSDSDDAGATWTAYRASLAAAEQAVALEPSNDHYRSMLGSIRRFRASRAALDGDTAATIVELRAAEAIFAPFVPAHPQDLVARFSLIDVRLRLAVSLRTAGDLGAAIDVARESLGVAASAPGTAPLPEVELDLAVTRGELARCLALERDRAGAAAMFDQAIAELTALQRDNPSLPGLDDALRDLRRDCAALAGAKPR